MAAKIVLVIDPDKASKEEAYRVLSQAYFDVGTSQSNLTPLSSEDRSPGLKVRVKYRPTLRQRVFHRKTEKPVINTYV